MTVRRLCALFSVGAVLAGVLTAPALAAGSHWTREPVPQPQRTGGRFAATDCVVSADGESCLAVGSFTDNDGAAQPLAELGHGDGWRSVGGPTLADAKEANFAAVSCVQPTLCFAVGAANVGYDFASRALAARWNGQSWQTFSLAPPAGDTEAETQLDAVSCSSAVRCVAVGRYYDDDYSPQTPFVLTWDGSSWTELPVELPPAETGAGLAGVDCPTAQWCVAVGYQYLRHDVEPMAGLITGGTFSYLAPPTRNTAGRFNGVSCPQAGACVLAGDSYTSAGTRTLVDEYHGGNWRLLDTPNVARAGNYFGAVSCSALDQCVAVGHTQGRQDQTLTEVRDGDTWQIVPSPIAPGNVDVELTAVSCPSNNDCVAVGYHYDRGRGRSQPISMRLHNGRWIQLPGGGRPGSAGSDFQAVSCPTVAFCVGVGDGPFAAVRSDRWSLASLPQIPDAAAAELAGVSCPAAGECVAVGWRNPDPQGVYRDDRAVVLRLHGGAWTQLSTARPDVWNEFHAVSCPTMTFCAAVGWNATRTAQVFDGTTWTSTALPASAPSGTDLLQGVSCMSAGQCIAVGVHYDNGGFEQFPVAFRWNGSIWSNAEGGLANSPSAVSCTSPTFCMAVGSVYGGADLFRPMSEVWDGSGWTPRETSRPNGEAVFHGVSCVSPQNCVATGYREGGPYELIEQWTGNRWLLRTDVDDSHTSIPVLRAASCASATDCVVVGTNGSGVALAVSTSG